jgi:TRAP-type C4-dicarboxylate transport system substrate-binding protein
VRLSVHLTLILGLLASPMVPGLTLKIATISPDGTRWMKTMRGAGEQIKSRTQGRVTLRFYPGGVMGNDRSVLRKIRVGQLHGGAVTGGALADIAPDANVYGLPFLFRDLAEVDRVRQEFDGVIAQRLAEQNMISFGFAEGGFSYLMSNEPIHSLADLKQRRVWSPEGDEVSTAAFDAMDIAPVSLPLIDVLTGLQTGLIDTVAASPVGAIALQWHTRITYVTDIPLSYIYGGLVIADKAFRRLSETDQTVVREVLGEAFETLDRMNRQDNIAAKDALKDQGVQFLSPPSSDRDELERAMQQAIDAMADKGYFSRSLVQRVRSAIRNVRGVNTAPGI